MNLLVYGAMALSTIWTPQQKDSAMAMCNTVFAEEFPVALERQKFCFCFATTFSLAVGYKDFLQNTEFYYNNFVANDNDLICLIVAKAEIKE